MSVMLVILMKRENNPTSNTYFSPSSPTITFNNLTMRPHRESLPLETPQNHHNQQRHSANLQGTHHNNAFAHLRTEISNLRSEFTRLIQKDGGGTQVREQRPKLPPYPKEERSAAHSTIGFYNQPEAKIEKGEYFFKSKLALNEHRPSVENAEDKKGKQAEGSKYHKKYSFQTQDRHDDIMHSQFISPTKIHQLQIQIRKLGEIKHKFQEENSQLKKDIAKMEKQYQGRLLAVQNQNQSLKNAVQQAQISISLKQSLVEKLEKEYTTYQTTIENYECRIKQLQDELKQQANQFNQLSQKNQKYQEKYLDQAKTIQNLQNIIKQLNIQLKQPSQNTERQIQQQKIKPLNDRIKILQQQNADFKKRVQSYKKSVQQLNNSNNSTRDKLVAVKEEARKNRQECKLLAEQLQMKEKLINSLYRDINILDADIRHSAHIKMLLNNHAKYIEQLTHSLLQLHCQQLNHKYSYLEEEESDQYC